MKKVPRSLRLFALLFMMVFTSNSFAAGYSCPAYIQYTSCAAGYYPTQTSSTTTCYNTLVAQNACRTCPTGYTCSGGSVTSSSSCPVANTYTVTLNANGGTGGTSSVTATYNSAMPSATMPTRTGYTFNGYYTATSGGTQYYTAAGASARTWNLTSATTLYAQWTIISRTCSAGTYLAAGATSCSACTAGSYCTGGTFSYNASSAQGITACTTRGSNYTSSAASSTASTSCYIPSSILTVDKYIATANSNTVSTCATGTYRAAGTYYYGSNAQTCSSCSNKPSAATYTSTGSGTNACPWSLTCSAGNYFLYNATETSRACSACTSGNYCTGTTATRTTSANAGLTACTTLGSNYTSSAASATANTSCYIPSSILTVDKYIATANSNTVSTCSTGTYRAAGTYYYGSTAQTCSSCSNKPSAATYTGTGSGANTCPWSLTCSAGNYFLYNATETSRACSACTSGNYCTGTTATRTTSANAGLTACSSLSGASPSGGTYTSATSSTSNTACKYTAPTKTITGCATVTSQQVTYSGSAWPASTYGVTANAGYVIANNNTSSATCSQCTNIAAFSPGGTLTSCISCPAQTTNWVRATGTGWDNNNDCYQTLTGSSISTYCNAGVIKQSGTASTSASTWNTSSNTITTPLQAVAGAYVNSQTCSQCSAGRYSTGGTITNCSSCAIGSYSAIGSSSCTACQGGTTTTSTGSSTCDENCSNDDGYVNDWLSAIWQTNNTVTNLCAIDTCFNGYSVSGGQCVANTYTVTLNANGGTVGTTSVTATYNSDMPAIATLPTRTSYAFLGFYDATTGGTQYYNSAGTSSNVWNKTSNTTLYARWSLSTVTCSAGQYLPGNSSTCATCLSGYYCVGGSYDLSSSSQGLTSCPNNYDDGGTGLSAQNQCKWQTTAGTYIATANNTSAATCTAGYYCPSSLVTYGSTGSRILCSSLTGVSVAGGVYTSATGSGASTSCKYTAPSKTITGCSVVTSQQVTYTGTSWPASTYYVSASGGYVIANNSTASATCNACSGSTYSTGGLSTSCTACLSNYTISGNTASDHDSVDDCKISCNAGTYIATANATTCTDVGNGYWAAATSDISQGTVSNREECPSGGYGHSSAPRDSINTCYAICDAGSYIDSPGSNCQTLSDNDKYIIENYVYYGDVSTVSTCDTANGYHIINKILASDHDSMYDCYQSCFAEDITPPTGATKIPANESEYYPNYCVYIASCPAGYDPIASGDFYDDSGYTTDPYCNANLMNITFDANGGTITDGGTTYEKTCLIGSSCVLNDTTLGRFQKTGYVFGGWSKTQSGSAVYQNNSDIGSSETSDLTLYAVWNQCAAGYVWNGNSCSACPVGSWKSGITAASGSAVTCTACAAGTTTASTASTSSNACVSCPVGSFCSADGSSMTSCSTLGDGSWTLSETGAQTSNQCYKNCPSYSVVYGTAMTDTGNVFYPNDCQYYCISETGNRGEVQAGKCVEKSCKNTFEMIGGVCQSCNRENAISYKTTGNCEIDSCASGYHPNGQSCEENIIECDAPNADESKKTWNSSKGSFSTCKIITCSYGYHLSSNACVADEQTCAIENGLGTKTWDDSKNVWGPCNVTSCNPGYTSEYSETNEHTKPCGACKNKYSILGEVAVSSYSRECEIASCMYQGELYNLENNECVPICDVAGYEDDTGTMKWNSSTKKCERQCKDGYTSWPSYSLPSTKIPDTSHSR